MNTQAALTLWSAEYFSCMARKWRVIPGGIRASTAETAMTEAKKRCNRSSIVRVKPADGAPLCSTCRRPRRNCICLIVIPELSV